MTSLVSTKNVYQAKSKNRPVAYVKKSLMVLAMLMTAASFNSAMAAGPQKDPLAGDSWHAVTPSWPGTLVFDGKAKKVVLSPVGAAPMEATYTYTVKPNTASGKGAVEGTLTMKNQEGQVSESTFIIKNSKELTLQFAGVQNIEKYVRMTAKEQEAEKERLQKMIMEGRVKPFKQP